VGDGRADGLTDRRPVRGRAQLPLLPPVRPSARPPVILDQRARGTQFVSLKATRILNPPAQTGMDFWSLNPYVGCEFGCSYCYARYAHRYVVERAHDAGKLTDAEVADYRGPHGWEAFERRIFVKEQILGALDADLRRVAAGETIVIGTATDPYQPGERRFRVTRGVLERLARSEGLSVGIITKSPLVARDVDVLRKLQARNALEVYVSLISVDAPLIRTLEVRSPTPAVRLRALQKLVAAGINAGLIVAPVLPGITDDMSHLEALFQAARQAGAQFLHAGPLRLYPAIRERFLPLLDEHFPQLAARYRRAYATRSSAPRDYARALSRRIRRLQARFGFPANDGMVDRYKSRMPVLQGELNL
jgi:DNA repair photolyase